MQPYAGQVAVIFQCHGSFLDAQTLGSCRKSWIFFQSQRLLLLGRSEPSLSPGYFTPLMILSFLLQQVKSLYQTLQQLKQDWLIAFQDFGFMGELRD